MTHHSNLKFNNGNGEMRKEGEQEYTACRNSKALLNIEQNVESLTEKMSSFELKLNYALLRQTKSKKRKRTLHHQDSRQSSTQQMYLNKLINSKVRIKTSVIYLSLILLLLYIILSISSELLLVGNELDYQSTLKILHLSIVSWHFISQYLWTIGHLKVRSSFKFKIFNGKFKSFSYGAKTPN